jgi:hypothetical protein
MKKTFDAVQWMRRRRAEIDEEDRGLSWEEKRCKTREIVMRDPILAPLCTQTKYAMEESAAQARETGAPYGAPEK